MESKINKRNMVIMGLMGLFIGIIVSTGISVSAATQHPNTIYMIASVIILTLGFGFWGSKMKPTVVIDRNSENKESLSKKEKTYIWIFSLINPIITGGVTYYIYKDVFPVKARQANIISFITFIPWFIWVLYWKGFFQI